MEAIMAEPLITEDLLAKLLANSARSAARTSTRDPS